MKRQYYTPWSDDDIRLLLSTTEQYLDVTIDWGMVVKHFPGRTALQCKSFYNNKMRKFVFNVDNGVPQPNFDLIQYCYVYYITRYKHSPESLDQKCKRIMAEACWEDIFPTMMLLIKNELNYKYNKKLLVGTKEFLTYHLLQCQKMDDLFKENEKIQIQDIVVHKKQWETFCKYINEMNPPEFLKRIDLFLEQIL
ncbi:Myb-like_DNA-binding domain-containing protein [Hexamita inflata]|uniref:Myb-like DNA-binding domain-containing protein n=1 Tax=Hexamita inflata TaxID=28002 RepID=A0AA86THZ1_9EUKA|nr:Myb-like DNA-binding domain-containing protein [Hexamita inflata]CAI9948188.1 Myb-like DNA-binding domain-containing protein [Hexamita inflata]